MQERRGIAAESYKLEVIRSSQKERLYKKLEPQRTRGTAAENAERRRPIGATPSESRFFWPAVQVSLGSLDDGHFARYSL